jgi:plasmid stabilization system protein ParE
VRGYRLTPRARDGLLRIARYVEERFGSGVAEGVVVELERAFQRLASAPEIGHRRGDLTADPDVRFWSVGPSLIAYRAGAEWLDVLFVERGEVDWERLLRAGE